MKTYCKGVDILGDEHLSAAYDEFARGKRTRREFASFFEMAREEVFAEARRMVRGRRLELPEITYFRRIEPTNGKRRLIGRESPMQQFLDYVCVVALESLFNAKVGYHQCASVRGKGQRHARRYIQRWVRDRRMRYYVKIDINKFYPNVDRAALFAMLERDICNDDLVWLIEALVSTHERGINIGSYLSQYLANYYLSGAFRRACELTRERRSRRTGEVSREKLVDHVLTYMDDWIFVARDKANLKSAVRKVQRYLLKALSATIKAWKVRLLDVEPVDMVGYVFRRDRTTVRPSIFLRARRAIMRAGRARSISPHAAARVISYWGYFKVTACRGFRDRHGLGAIVATCRRVVSACTRKGVMRNAACAQLGAAG